MLSSFRYHDRRPPQVSSPLYRQLIDEWIDLNQLNSSRLAVRRWGQAEPALQGHGRPADLVDAVDGADAAGQDRMLLALVRLTQAGYQLAGRVVLQLMLPKLGRIAIRTAGHGSDSAWTEDRRHIVVAEFWDVISGYPVERRASSLAANLSLETLRRVTNPRSREQDRPVDPEVLKQRIGEQVELALPGTLSIDSSFDEVLGWAVYHRAITRADGQLLALVYRPQPGPSGTAEVARDLGCTTAAIRQRCSRARRRLIAAVQAQMTAEGLAAVA